MKLESIGKILVAGFGDRVLIGVLMGFLDSIMPSRLYEYIRDELKLGYWVPESDWDKYKKLAKQANIADLDTEMVISELRKWRPDLLSVIINHPQGLSWLDTQVIEMKKRLELE